MQATGLDSVPTLAAMHDRHWKRWKVQTAVGGGPVLVDAKPYRLSSPTKRHLATWRKERDPLAHMERYLKAKGLFTSRWKEQVVQEFSQKLDAAVKAEQKAQRASQK